MSIRINIPHGYDLLSSVHSWIFPDIQPVPECTGDGYFGRVYDIHDRHYVLIIEQSRPGEALQVHQSSNDIVKRDIMRLIKRTLGLEIEMTAALKQMRDDSVLASLVKDIQGIRPYMSPTPFEALIKTIIQQQISYRAANIFTKRMILGLTNPVVFRNRSWFKFPDATTLTKIGSEGLRKYGFGFKAEYIHGVASLIEQDDLELDSLVGASFEEVLEVLLPIRGIGEWTVRVLAIAGLGDFSIFAHNDLVIQKILGKLYNNGVQMSPEQVSVQAQSWGESGNLVLYLLMCAEVLGLIRI